MLKVEQSDRDAAAALWLKNRPESGRVGTESNYWWQKLKAGEFDHNESAQAFAAYREAIMERAAVMAEQHEPVGYMSDRERSYCIDHGQEIADIIREHGGTHDQG